MDQYYVQCSDSLAKVDFESKTKSQIKLLIIHRDDVDNKKKLKAELAVYTFRM